MKRFYFITLFMLGITVVDGAQAEKADADKGEEKSTYPPLIHNRCPGERSCLPRYFVPNYGASLGPSSTSS